MRWSVADIDSEMSAQELSQAKISIRPKWLWHQSQVYCLAFDKSGKFVFTGGDDGVVRVYSLAADELVKALYDETSVEFSAAVDSASRALESASQDTNLESDLERLAINDIAVNDQNSLLAAAKHSGAILVWNLQTLALIIRFDEQSHPIRTILFTSGTFDDHSYLISTSEDGFVFFYSYNNKTLEFKPTSVHRKGKYDGERAINICVDKSTGGHLLGLIYTFGVGTNASMPKSKKVPVLKCSAQSAIRICSLSEELGLRDEWKRTCLKSHTECVYSLRFSNKSFRFATACDNDPNALIWSYDKGNKKWEEIIVDINAKPGSKKLLRGKSKQVAEGSVFVDELLFTIDDKYLITLLTDFSVKVWNAVSGELVQHFAGYHSKKISVIDKHPINGNIFLSAGYDSKIFIYDIESGTVIRRLILDGTQSEVKAAAEAEVEPSTSESQSLDLIKLQLLQCYFSPDGRTIASSDDCGNLTIFSIELPEETKALNTLDQLEEKLFKIHSEGDILKETKVEVKIEPTEDNTNLMQAVFEYETELLKGNEKSSPFKANGDKPKLPKKMPALKLEETDPNQTSAKKTVPISGTKAKTIKKKTPAKKAKELNSDELTEMNGKAEANNPEPHKDVIQSGRQESDKTPKKKTPLNAKETKAIFAKILDDIFENPNSLPFQTNDEIQFPNYRKEISDADLCLTSIKEEMLMNQRYSFGRFNKDVNKVLENAKTFYKHNDDEIYEMALTLEKFYCNKMSAQFGDTFKPPSAEPESSDDESHSIEVLPSGRPSSSAEALADTSNGNHSKAKPLSKKEEKRSQKVIADDNKISDSEQQVLHILSGRKSAQQPKTKRSSASRVSDTPNKRAKTSAKTYDSDKEIIDDEMSPEAEPEPEPEVEPLVPMLSEESVTDPTINGNTGVECCDKTNSSSNNLFCIFCDETFGQKSAAKEHYIRHLCPIQCQKCRQSFVSYDSYLSVSHECDSPKSADGLLWDRHHSDSVIWIEKFLNYQESDDIESFEPIVDQIRSCIVCEKVQALRIETQTKIREIRSVARDVHLEKHLKYVLQYQCMLCFLKHDNYFYCKTSAEAEKHLTAEHNSYPINDGNPLQYFDSSIPKLDQIFKKFYQ